MEFIETIREFREGIAAQRENLNYLKQASSSYGAIRDRQFGEALDHLFDGVEGAFGEQLEGEVDFEKIRKATQLAQLLKTNVMSGEAMRREIKRLREFFLEEEQRVIELEERIQNAIDNLGVSLEEPPSEEELQLAMNKYMNSSVPEAGKDLDDVRAEITRLLNELRSGLTEDLSASKINQLSSELTTAKDKLDFTGDMSIFESIAQFIGEWEGIRNSFERISGPLEIEDIGDIFEEVWENIQNSYKGLDIMARGLRETIFYINDTETTLLDDWNATVDHVFTRTIINLDTGESSTGQPLENFEDLEPFKNALKEFIETGFNQFFSVTGTRVGTVINDNNFPVWFERANLIKNNRRTWQNDFQEIIDHLDQILEHDSTDYVGAMDTINTPLFDAVIDFYKGIIDPIWGSIESIMNGIEITIRRINKGLLAAANIKDALDRFVEHIGTLKTALSDIREWFRSEEEGGFGPEEKLNSAMGLGTSSAALFNGLIYSADSLGLDNMSDMIMKGNGAELWDISKEDAQLASDVVEGLGALGEGQDLLRRGFRSELVGMIGERAADLFFSIKDRVESRRRRQARIEEFNEDDVEVVLKEEKKIEEQEMQLNEFNQLV